LQTFQCLEGVRYYFSMKVQGIILQSVVGLLLGAGIGAVLGFITFAIGEKLNPSGGEFVILLPSGPLMVGIFGAILMGIMGVVIGLITGLFRLGVPSAAGVGILIFALLKGRVIYYDLLSRASDYRQGGHLDRRASFMNSVDLMFLLELVMIGVLVAVVLRHLIVGPGNTSEALDI
jgi:hypothetical protein